MMTIITLIMSIDADQELLIRTHSEEIPSGRLLGKGDEIKYGLTYKDIMGHVT